jgi:hypothetical protein
MGGFSGAAVVVAFGGAYVAAVTVSTRGWVRTILLVLGAVAISLAALVVIGITLNPG